MRMTERLCIATLSLAGLLAGCQANNLTQIRVGSSLPSNATLLVDSASYHLTVNALGFYTGTVRASLHNAGASTLYVRRACDTGDVPGGQFLRLAGDTSSSRLLVEGVCSLDGVPVNLLPNPISVLPGTTYSWTAHVVSSGTNAQIAQTAVTGRFQLVVIAMSANRPGSSYLASEVLPDSMRTSPIMTYAYP